MTLGGFPQRCGPRAPIGAALCASRGGGAKGQGGGRGCPPGSPTTTDRGEGGGPAAPKGGTRKGPPGRGPTGSAALADVGDVKDVGTDATAAADWPARRAQAPRRASPGGP